MARDKREYNREYFRKNLKKTDRTAGLPLKERFDRMHVPVTESGCWLWTGSTSRGYGQLSSSVGKAPHKAHRLSWQLHRGEIPAGMLLCHKCDTPQCVNPDHLFLGTDRDNIEDARSKGRLVQKLSIDAVKEIVSDLDISGAEMARRHGVSTTRVNTHRRKHIAQSQATQDGKPAELPERKPLRLFVYTHGED